MDDIPDTSRNKYQFYRWLSRILVLTGVLLTGIPLYQTFKTTNGLFDWFAIFLIGVSLVDYLLALIILWFSPLVGSIMVLGTVPYIILARFAADFLTSDLLTRVIIIFSNVLLISGGILLLIDGISQYREKHKISNAVSK